MHYLSKLRKESPGLAINLDRKIDEICELFQADAMCLPVLNPRRQALFAIGYYHQRNDFYRSRDGVREEEKAASPKTGV